MSWLRDLGRDLFLAAQMMRALDPMVALRAE
jgi:hypothetical protein